MEETFDRLHLLQYEGQTRPLGAPAEQKWNSHIR